MSRGSKESGTIFKGEAKCALASVKTYLLSKQEDTGNRELTEKIKTDLKVIEGYIEQK